MDTEYPFDTAHEVKTHTGVIRHISRQLDVPEEKVARLFDIVLSRYKARARITNFLVILAARRAEDLLRNWKERHPCT